MSGGGSRAARELRSAAPSVAEPAPSPRSSSGAITPRDAIASATPVHLDDALAKKVAEFEEAVENFETFLQVHQGDSDGPFLCGTEMCFGEANMAPFVARAIPNLKHFCDVDVKEICKRHPRVNRLVTAILERPSVASTRPSDDEIVAGMTRMMKMFASK